MNQYEYMSFYNLHQYDDSIWIDNIVTNDLVRLDKNTLHIMEIVDLHLESHASQVNAGYFIQMVQYGNCLYLFPYNSIGEIVIYNLVTREIRYCPMGLEGVCGEYKELFFEGVPYDAFFRIIPPRLEVPFMLYDFKAERMLYDWKWNERVERLCGRNISLNRYFAQMDKYIYIPLEGSSDIIISDMETGDIELLKLPLPEKKIHSIAVDAEYIWVTMVGENCLYKCKKEKVSEIKVFPLNNDSKSTGSRNRQRYTRIITLRDRAIVLPSDPSFLRDIYILDKNTDQVKKIPDKNFPSKLKPLIDFRSAYDLFWGYSVKGRHLFLYPCGTNMALEIDIDSCSVKGYSTYLYEKKMVPYFTEKFRSIEQGGKQELGDVLTSRYGLDIINQMLCAGSEKI